MRSTCPISHIWLKLTLPSLAHEGMSLHQRNTLHALWKPGWFGCRPPTATAPRRTEVGSPKAAQAEIAQPHFPEWFLTCSAHTYQQGLMGNWGSDLETIALLPTFRKERGRLDRTIPKPCADFVQCISQLKLAFWGLPKQRELLPFSRSGEMGCRQS